MVLARLRERLKARGLKLMLDFVPNHTGLDHPWVIDHPEYYIAGSELDLARAPKNYTWAFNCTSMETPAAGYTVSDPYFLPAGPTRFSSITATRQPRRR